MIDLRALVVPIPGANPSVAPTAWVAPGVVLTGNVTVSAQASIWYNCVLRSEGEAIVIGERTNIQDGTICHVDAGRPLTIGDGVSVGHGAVLHGCTIEDDVLVGMGSRILNGAVIGGESLVAAGSVVLEDTVVPARSLVAGVPARVHRALTDEEVAGIRRNAQAYLSHAALYRAAPDRD
jgi:carbonic anhydrase/acetyltransferase-like protein (isoleucine patch superfamily)